MSEKHPQRTTNDNDSRCMLMMDRMDTNPGLHLPPIPTLFQQQQQQQQQQIGEVLCDSTFDKSNVIATDEYNNMMPTNAITSARSTTFDETEDSSFYYADEASLYSIAENSREDIIDDTTATTATAITPSPITTTALLNATTTSIGTIHSHTTSPINNVTSFDDRKEIGMELSYAAVTPRNVRDHRDHPVTTSDMDDVCTKASDEGLRTYYYFNNRGRSGRRWYHPKCRRMIMIGVLVLFLLLGIIFVSTAVTIYQSRKKQSMKSSSSIESDPTDNNTAAIMTASPSSLRHAPTHTPISQQEFMYRLSENYVYNAIKNCHGTGTFFDVTTIQGRVFTRLVQEVYENIRIVIAMDESGSSGSNSAIEITTTNNYEFASDHTIDYLREKYSLNVLFLYTQGESSWKVNTHWMSLTNPCPTITTDIKIDDTTTAEDETWYGIQCSNSSISAITTGSSSTAESSSRSSMTCDATQSPRRHVIGIALSNNNLTGVLPNELCCLPCIERIDISNNSIGGDVLWCINEISTLTEININYNPIRYSDTTTSTTTNSGNDNTTTSSTMGAGTMDLP